MPLNACFYRDAPLSDDTIRGYTGILSGLEVHRRSGYCKGINKNEYYAGQIRTVRRTLGLEVDMEVIGGGFGMR